MTKKSAGIGVREKDIDNWMSQIVASNDASIVNSKRKTQFVRS